MAASTGSFSYGDLSTRESLWDQIKDLDPLENYVTSTSAEVEVGQKVHSWVVDPIASTSSQEGTVELTATSYAATNPTLLTNTTQIIEKGFRVSATNINSDHAAFADKFAREQLKKMKEWKQQLEYSVVVGTKVSGTGTAARKMDGIVRFASTLASTQGSGVSLASNMLNAYLGNAYEAGDDHDTVLVGRTLKERISSFTQGNTVNVNAEDAIRVGRVDIYDSDHGRVEIIKHRYVDDASSTIGQPLVTYIKDYIAVGYLDPVHVEDRAKDGYYESGAVVGEYTCQVGNEKAVQLIQSLL